MRQQPQPGILVSRAPYGVRLSKALRAPGQGSRQRWKKQPFIFVGKNLLENHLEHLTVACVGPPLYFGTANPPMQSPSLSFQPFNESLSKSHLAGVEFGLLLHELKFVLAQGMFK